MTSVALRRSLSVLVALVLATALPVALTGPTVAVAEPAPVPTALRSYELDPVPTEAALAPESGRSVAPALRDEARSSEVRLDGRAHVVGVTWPRGSVAEDATVEIREERDGVWGDWRVLDSHIDEGPDPDTAEEDGSRGGTAPWISTADALQVRVTGDTENAGRSARLDVVDATTTEADRSIAASAAGAAAAAGTKPVIHTRAQWGADESIRHAKQYYGEVKAAVVHHTVGSNDYTAAQVPSIIRGIYVFHTNGRNWGDMGYNFLVDRFGGTWEGRYGGMTKAVVGAHSYGVNSQTSGTSVLGDFTSATPPQAVVTAQAKLIAWKLGLSYVDPSASTYLDGQGTMPTVIGHRDVYSTSCPGPKLYARLPDIRSAAKSYQGAMFYDPSISRQSYSYGGLGVTVRAKAGKALSWTLTVSSVCRNGSVHTLRGTTSSAAWFEAAWDGRLGNGDPLPPGDYRVELNAGTGSGERDTALSASWPLTVNTTSKAPPGYCPPRLAGADRFAVAVATSRERLPDSTSVVLVNGHDQAMADALVAGPLAARTGSVLLLTSASSLPSVTAAEVSRRGVRTVTIVGGTASVSQGVESQLRDLGVTTISRVGGSDRYSVAANVARRVVTGSSAPDVVVASGRQSSIADGLVLSGPATALRRPILLVAPTVIPEATATVLSDLAVRRSVVTGGTASVSAEVLDQLPSAKRIGGQTRYDVAVGVASWAKSLGVPAGSVLVSSGKQSALADTLSGGQLGRPILYVRPESVPSPVVTWLRGNTALTEATVVGGTASVWLVTGGTVQREVLG
ncbi:cell wall-binding repeat-containing protein [uncultured Phycicoccus sp.]|uniref:cell wall-binding repeat-containing protein n=1 Tax=uncultured Phycicoccus sp. TaxID=661422 RepID=UPI002616D48E|nr:cell wall-binding repeat-containing protein [uncultured Phycicoccus sp.]